MYPVDPQWARRRPSAWPAAGQGLSLPAAEVRRSQERWIDAWLRVVTR